MPKLVGRGLLDYQALKEGADPRVLLTHYMCTASLLPFIRLIIYFLGDIGDPGNVGEQGPPAPWQRMS
jgi:hypothetical protein